VVGSLASAWESQLDPGSELADMSEPPMSIAYRAKKQIGRLRDSEPPTPVFNSGDHVSPNPDVVDAIDTLCDAVIKLMERLANGGPA
jgi:hypothetical protein